MKLAPVALAVAMSGRGWDIQLIRHVRDFGGAHVVGRFVNDQDARTAAFGVLIADDATSWLSQALVATLRAQGKRVIGLYDASHAGADTAMRALGVDAALPLDTPPGALLRAAEEIAGGEPQPDPDSNDALLQQLLDATGAIGSVVAVGSCGAGSGATETALAVAGHLGRVGTTVVVDADPVHPSVAPRLSLPPFPNLRRAVTLENGSPQMLLDLLARAAQDAFQVLPGLPDVHDWADTPAERVRHVIRSLSELFDFVVVKVGKHLSEHPADGQAERRHELTRQAIQEAGHVVAVTDCTVAGLGRLLSWQEEARPLIAGRRLHVLLNRAALSDWHTRQLCETVAERITPYSVTSARIDRIVLEAEWRGELPARGALHDAAARLAAAIGALPPQPAARRATRQRGLLLPALRLRSPGRVRTAIPEEALQWPAR